MPTKLKWIIVALIFLTGFLIYLVHHNLVFDWRLNFASFSYTWVSIKNNYITFYIKKNEDPTYLFKSDIFDQYNKYCHQHKKNCIIFPFQQIYADLLWLGTIQYLGSVIDVAKAPYMYDMLNNLSNLSPYWDYPYYFGELMLPLSRSMHSDLWIDKLKTSWINSIKYWEKWKYYNCDKEKIKWILSLTDKTFFEDVYLKTGSWKKYLKPCDIYEIPYQLWFNYWYYLQDSEKSAQNYKIASFFEDIPLVTPRMVIIVNSRKWNFEKSMQLAFLRYISLIKKLNNVKSEEDKKILNSKIDESIRSSVIQYLFWVLQRADNLIWSQNKCYHDFECLAQNGYITKVISEDIKSCKESNIDFTKLSIDDILSLDENQLSKISKCYVLWYAIQEGFVNLRKYPYLFYYLDDGTKYNFVFDWDLNSWWFRPQH